MRKHVLAASIVVAGYMGLAVETGATEGFRQLKGPEITARFTEMEFTDGIHWGLVFRKGGRVAAIETSGRITAVEREPRLGRWHVARDELCFGVSGSDERCHQVWVSGQSVQLRGAGDVPHDGLLQKPQARR